MVNYSTMPSVGRVAIMAASFLGAANAHMFMREPKPFEGYSPKDPLEPSGSNFPCHGAPLDPSGGQKLTAGGSFDFKLESGDGANTAVHGGGSCQLSITYETDSEKAKDPKNWHVIYSIEGGCPANAEANLKPGFEYCESDGQAECLHSWQIPVPKGVKSGDAILAWTWQNTLGNREFYMNCAPVTIEGGSGDEEFPALFVANMPSVEGGECGTTASMDVLYPNPGQYGTTMSATDGKNWEKATPTGQGCGSGGSSNAQPTGSYGDSGSSGDKGSSGGKGSSESAPSATAAPSYGAPAQSAPAYGASSQIQHSYTQQKGKQTATTFATAASTAAASSAAPSSAAPSSAAPEPSSYSSSSSGSGSESNATSSDDCEPCDEDGALICIGNDSFGICDHSCAVPRALSAGTVCTDGVIGSATKNRFARRHAHFGAHKH
ncbi:hypothetical protein Q7P37_000674 [Cladosporium fusiforme]